MKFSSNYKFEAREALYGNWGTAVLVSFVATLCGSTIGVIANFIPSFDPTTTDVDAWLRSLPSGHIGTIALFLLVLYGVILFFSLANFLLRGPIRLGLVRFYLNLVDGKPASLRDLFSQFRRFGPALLAELLMSVYLTLWTLLCVIPGIVKSFSYAMTPYIMLEHPELSANQAITESCYIMDGNKWRLFCLRCSFFGWYLLIMLPSILLGFLPFDGLFGTMVYTFISGGFAFIGTLFLAPYEAAATSAFYRDITATTAE